MTTSATRKPIYPPNWKELAKACKDAAGWRCEWCRVKHGDVRRNIKGQLYSVILTVHHPDGNTSDPNARLIALCPACHLRDDAPMHAKHAQETRNRNQREAMLDAGQLLLLQDEVQL